MNVGLKSLCIALLLGASLHMPAQAAGKARAFDAQRAVKAFHDHCVVNRSRPARFTETVNAIATPMDVYSAHPYAMGEQGHGWWMREGDAVFFLTPLSRCRMFILSGNMDGLPAAFDRMANNPPEGLASHAFEYEGRAMRNDFIWTKKSARPTERPTRIQLLPSRKDRLDPPAARWILTADDHIGTPAPMQWDPNGTP